MISLSIQEIKREIELLCTYGNLGFYEYCEVVQVVLIQNGICHNYFTHVEFKSDDIFKKTIDEYVTKKPHTINSNLRLAIKRYNLNISQFIDIYLESFTSNEWKYENDHVILDQVFCSGKKYIPEIDPTSGQYNLHIPLAWALYGTNFAGNYYIHELFSRKMNLNKLFDEKSCDKILSVLKSYNIGYDFNYLEDRIGNIVCKFNIEVMDMIPKKLGALNGIEYSIMFNKKNIRNLSLTLQILIEHDGLIYQNSIDTDFKDSIIAIEPNQCKNTIFIIDNNTKLMLYSAVYDYSILGDYSSEIIPDQFVVSRFGKRILKAKNVNHEIELFNKQPIGAIYNIDENNMVTERQIKNEIVFQKTKGYLFSYIQNEHDKAVDDIKNITKNNILWDLEEILVLDPYLSVDDILETLVYCPKPNLRIRALCSYKTIHENRETKDSACAEDIFSFIENAKFRIDETLGENTDIQLTYRTIINGNGFGFHDRYIILKYDVNRTRVWSIGTSLNSIGSKHHIIQKVYDPEMILDIFEDLWIRTEENSCLIYSNV